VGDNYEDRLVSELTAAPVSHEQESLKITLLAPVRGGDPECGGTDASLVLAAFCCSLTAYGTSFSVGIRASAAARGRRRRLGEGSGDVDDRLARSRRRALCSSIPYILGCHVDCSPLVMGVVTTTTGGTAVLEKVFYTSVLVSDQDKALDFYTNVLGLEKRVENPTPPRWRARGRLVLVGCDHLVAVGGGACICGEQGSGPVRYGPRRTAASASVLVPKRVPG
jgi:hypothetical protein